MKLKVSKHEGEMHKFLGNQSKCQKVLLKLIFINGNEKRVATPPPKFYSKYSCFPTKDTPQPKVKFG
jgi:hypothetical protein